jgi:excisionase family DNA binding protein
MTLEDTGARLPSRLAFSPDEAAELLGLSRELLNDLIRTGALKSKKAGRRRIISRHHLAAFLGVPEASIV